jgi:hypothetical protein
MEKSTKILLGLGLGLVTVSATTAFVLTGGTNLIHRMVHAPDPIVTID